MFSLKVDLVFYVGQDFPYERTCPALPPGSGAPGASPSLWISAAVHTGFNIEFAILADLDNDGKAFEVLAQENGGSVPHLFRVTAP